MVPIIRVEFMLKELIVSVTSDEVASIFFVFSILLFTECSLKIK